jgi:hypothetical protein
MTRRRAYAANQPSVAAGCIDDDAFTHNMLTKDRVDTQYLVVPRFARECDEKGNPVRDRSKPELPPQL